MDELKGKAAVITGGTRGLGFGIAQAYIRAGAKVVVASRTRESVEAAVLVLEEMGGEAGGIKCDVGILEDVESLARYTIKKYGYSGACTAIRHDGSIAGRYVDR